MWSDPPRHSHAACARFLDGLLLEPEDLLAALAPEGWEGSPLVRAFHPTPEQIAEETERFRRNLAALRGEAEAGDADESMGGDDVDEIESASDQRQSDPIDPEREIVELVGHALWDVFSANHTVVDADHSGSPSGARSALGAIGIRVVRRCELVEMRNFQRIADGPVGVSHAEETSR